MEKEKWRGKLFLYSEGLCWPVVVRESVGTENEELS